MHVLRISLFGKLGDIIAREIDFEDGRAANVGDLRRALALAYPHAASDVLSPRVRVCVNDTVAGDGQPLVARDEVALLPPVSGG